MTLEMMMAFRKKKFPLKKEIIDKLDFIKILNFCFAS